MNLLFVLEGDLYMLWGRLVAQKRVINASKDLQPRPGDLWNMYTG